MDNQDAKSDPTAPEPDGAPPPQDPFADPFKLPQSTYQIAVTFQCASCKTGSGITEPQVLMAASQRAAVALRCPRCGHPQLIVPPAAPDEPRIIRPGTTMNRHERRLAALGRVPR